MEKVDDPAEGEREVTDHHQDDQDALGDVNALYSLLHEYFSKDNKILSIEHL